MSASATGATSVVVELVRHRLEAATREMTEVLRRASYSPLIRESLDFSNALHRPDGETVAQYAGLPFLAGAMTGAARSVVRDLGLEHVREGDVLLSNDPYLAGGTHVNDLAVVMPIFADGELLLLAQTKAHMLDVGGRDVGSWALDATDIHQEGIRIPHVRLMRAGAWDEDVLALILANVRLPRQLRADLEAMVGACRVASRRVADCCAKFGTAAVQRACEAILDHAERRMRARIAALPDGVYRSSDVVENDGVTDEPLNIEVAVTVSGDEILVDYAGSSSQARGSNGNMIFGGAVASARLALRCVLDPRGPDNDGAFRCVTVTAPEGTCVNPIAPAPVTVGLASVAHCALESVMRALAPAVPERVIADQFGNIQTLVLSGPWPDTTDPFIHFMVYPGGSGARQRADGLDGVVNLCDSGVRNVPAEVIESTFPLRVERMELRTDSAGPGRMRGGLGVAIDYRVLIDGVTAATALNRYRIAPRGLAGGEDGAKSATVLIDGADVEHEYCFDAFPVRANDVVSHRTGGGGGFGPPAERDPALVAAEVRAGTLSPRAATRVYGPAWSDAEPAA